MNVTRIMSKTGKITINYEQFNQNTELPDHMGCISEDLPVPEFSEAFNKMKRHLLTLTDLPENDLEKMHMVGIDIKYTGEAYLSAQLYGTRDVSISKSGHDLKSAWFGYDEDGENDPKGKNVLSDEIHDDLETVIELAIEYLNGARAQKVLEFDGEEPDVAM